MTRDPAFDIARGLGVIMVLAGHLNLPFWIINLIYFFHMPLFVIISGYFHKRGTTQNLLKSIGRLFLAYLLYGVFFLCLTWVISGRLDTHSLFLLFLGRAGNIWSIPYFGIFWFIITLIVIRIAAHLFPLNKITLVVSLVLFFVISYLQKKNIYLDDLPFTLGQAGMLFFFYVIGYLSRQYVSILREKRWIFYLAFAALSLISIVLANGRGIKIVNYHHLSLFNPVIALLLAILGSVSLILFSETLVKYTNWINRNLQSVGEYSFIYFALHLFVFAVLSAILNCLGIDNYFVRLLSMLLGTLFICRITVFLLLRLKKIIPVTATMILLK